MWYTFYINERMVLDNWKYYQEKYKECNSLLRQLVLKNEDFSVSEAVDFYNNNRRIVNSKLRQLAENYDWYWNFYVNEYLDIKDTLASEEDNYNTVRFALENSMDEHFSNRGKYCSITYAEFLDKIQHYEKNRHYNFYKNKSDNWKNHVKLRNITNVTIYKSDIRIIRDIKKKYHCTQEELEILFGMIFFSRMYDSKYCRIGTKFKYKQFCKCLGNVSNSRISTTINKICDEYGVFDRIHLDNSDESPEHYHFYFIGKQDDYIYKCFDNKDEIYTVITVTDKNNKLDIQKMYKQTVRDKNIKYCSLCNRRFKPNSNRQKYCDDCAVKMKAQGSKERQKRYREKCTQQMLFDNLENE